MEESKKEITSPQSNIENPLEVESKAKEVTQFKFDAQRQKLPVSRKLPKPEFVLLAEREALNRRSVFENSSRAYVQEHSDYLVQFSKFSGSQQHMDSDSREISEQNVQLKR